MRPEQHRFESPKARRLVHAHFTILIALLSLAESKAELLGRLGTLRRIKAALQSAREDARLLDALPPHVPADRPRAGGRAGRRGFNSLHPPQSRN